MNGVKNTNKIKEIRARTALSQAAFAERYAIPLRSLQRWEQGQNEPAAHIVKLLEAYVNSCGEKRYGLPEKFRAAFWDTDFSALNAIKQRDFIICRLYCHGGTDGIKWVESVYPKEDIVHAAKNRCDLNPVVANYLSIKFGIPRSEMRYYDSAASDWRKASIQHKSKAESDII